MKPKSSLPNPFVNKPFILGFEPAYLGNCLSSLANLIVFSIRNNVPIIYPDINKYNSIFLNQNKNHHIFDPLGLLDETFALTFSSMARPFISDAVSTQYEELDSFRCQGLTLFLPNDPIQKIRDWTDNGMEGNVATFCAQGNGLIMPRVFWNQYTDMRTAAIYARALREHLGELRPDSVANRSTHMMDHNNHLRIGIHIRRSDSRYWYGGAYFFSIEDYVRVIKSLHSSLHFTPHIFYIFASERIDPSAFEDLPIFYTEAEFQDDFIAMGTCDYIVGPPSTFATWSAFLNGAKRLILTRERIDNIDKIQSILDLAVNIPFPTGGYLPGDLRASPV